MNYSSMYFFDLELINLFDMYFYGNSSFAKQMLHNKRDSLAQKH